MAVISRNTKTTGVVHVVRIYSVYSTPARAAAMAFFCGSRLRFTPDFDLAYGFSHSSGDNIDLEADIGNEAL
jgi:hypothetical protein